MDPRGAYKDIETLSAIERLFTPPCNIKILLTIDKNAKNADRGQSIIKRLTNLRSFFTDEEKLRSAISIVVNKQRISNGKALFESMGLFNIKPNTNEARDIAKATMTSEQDLVWVSSFLTHIRDNNRIFAFPEPKTIGPYNYGWFPDREGLIKALTTLPVHDPKINIFANFSQDPRTLLLMERAAGSLKSAIEGIKILFDTLRKSIPFDAGSLALAKTVIEQLNNLNENQINTPAKLASELRKRLIYFNAYINAAGQEECKKILDDLSSSEGYLILLDKMNKGDRAQRWRRDIPPIPETLKKFTSGSINDIVKVLNEMGSCCDGDNLNATKLALRAACTS